MRRNCYAGGRLLGLEIVVKLLIYSHAFAPQVGGVETFSMSLAQGLATFRGNPSATRFSVLVITQTTGNSEETDSTLPFKVVRRPSIWRLWRLIGSVDKVLLAGPAILPMTFALVLRRPLVITHHGYQSMCPNGMLFQFTMERTCPGHFAAGRYIECIKCNSAQQRLPGSIRSLLLTFVRRALASFACVNVAVSEHLSGRTLLPRSLVIRNGVPAEAVPAEPPSSGAQAPATFAYLGRLITEKGIPVLIRAASILKDRGCRVRILIIGDGPELASLQSQASHLKLGGDIEFLGFQAGPRLDELLTGVSALVLPSICEDVAPFSVLEQMMQGRFIIGSLLGGLAEEIGDAGLTFPPGDALQLAKQMEEVIERPELVGTLRKKARERALQFYTRERMLRDYRGLLSNNPKRLHEIKTKTSKVR